MDKGVPKMHEPYDMMPIEPPRLTKRELFAALAMAAIVPVIHPMTDFDKGSLNEVIAIQAVRMADALLSALAKEEGA